MLCHSTHGDIFITEKRIAEKHHASFESLRLRGIRDRASARALVERARRQATMSEAAAVDLAVAETRKVRKR